MSEETQDKLAQIEERRAKKKADAEAAYREQRAADFEALEALEVEHGEAEICHVDLNAPSPGMPTLVAGRALKPAELKRYRARIKVEHGKAVKIEGSTEAAEELAASCLIYPSKEVYDRLLVLRPGTAAALGNAILHRASAKAEEEGKG